MELHIRTFHPEKYATPTKTPTTVIEPEGSEVVYDEGALQRAILAAKAAKKAAQEAAAKEEGLTPSVYDTSPIIPCPYCGWTGHASQLEAHLHSVHPELFVSDGGVTHVEGMVACPYCGIKFYESQLDEHIKTHHTYVCPVCGLVLHSIEEYNEHMKTHQKKPETPVCVDYRTSPNQTFTWQNKNNLNWYATEAECLAGLPYPTTPAQPEEPTPPVEPTPIPEPEPEDKKKEGFKGYIPLLIAFLIGIGKHKKA
jgi:rubrerythrin